MPETMISYKDQPTTIAESRIDVIKDLMQIAAAMNDPKYIKVISSIFPMAGTLVGQSS